MTETAAGAILATQEMRVPMHDVDAAGIIFFGAPYSWHEALYTSWLAAIGRPLSGLLRRGYATATVASSARYVAPLALDDVVRLDLRPGSIGRTSFAMHSDARLLPGGELAVAVTCRHVWTVTPASGDLGPGERIGARPLPDWLRAALSGAAA